MVHPPIYLDNNATTRTDPRVVQAMLPYFSDIYGNASSRHHEFGRQAAEAVATARAEVACLIGADPREIIFTSGATESDNLALKGAAAIYRNQGNHLISVATEHSAVLDTCRRLEGDGFQVTILPVDRFGQVSASQVAQAITEKTILISVMAANNEIGTLQPLGEIGKVCKERGILFHTDAAQAVGKIPIDVEAEAIDLLSLSGHKLYGPKGIGALYIRRSTPRVALAPLFDGGGHEKGWRSGTLAVPNIVGLGAACRICLEEMASEADKLQRLRERLRMGIMGQVDEVTLNGHPTERLPGNLNLSFAHVDGEVLLIGMNNVALSAAAACTTASLKPSHVLQALGASDELARGSIRFGLGRFNDEEEIDFVIAEVVRTVRHLRAHSPAYEIAQQSRKSKTEVAPEAPALV